MFEARDYSEALDELLRRDGPFLSVYLPYGIRSANENELRISRKNTLTVARNKLAGNVEHVWLNYLSFIEMADRSLTDQRGTVVLPRTDVYIATHDFSVKVEMHAILHPHFSFAPFAEIEPLIYARWIDEAFYVLKLDPSGPRLYEGHSGEMYPVEFSVPMGLRDIFPSDQSEFSLNEVVEILDRNNRPGSGLGMNDFSGYYGLSSRYNGHGEINRNYWIKLMSDLFDETITDQYRKVFLVGDKELCYAFIAINRGRWFSEDRIIGPFGKFSDRDIAEKVSGKITDEKLEAASTEMDRLKVNDNMNDLVSMIEARQIRKLFVQRDDWFGQESSSHGHYEYSNPRAMILANVLRNGTPIAYTQQKIHNKHGLAGVAY